MRLMTIALSAQPPRQIFTTAASTNGFDLCDLASVASFCVTSVRHQLNLNHVIMRLRRFIILDESRTLERRKVVVQVLGHSGAGQSGL